MYSRITPTAIFAVTFLLAGLTGGCSSTDPASEIPRILSERRTTDVYNTIVDQIAKYQIVLLADNGHTNYTFREGVLDVLDAWFERMSQDPAPPPVCAP